MATFVIGTLILIAGLVIFFVFNSPKSGVPKGIAITTLLIGLIGGLLSMTLSCVSTVPTGHTGILTTFGKVEDTNLPNGVNFHFPWQKIITMDNRTQKYSGQTLAFSKDIQETTINLSVNYSVDPAATPTLYKTVGTDYFNTIVVPRLAETVKTHFGRYNAEQLISDRNKIANSIGTDLAATLKPYGINVVVTIDNIDFSDAFTNAVEAKQVATQEKLTAEIRQQQQVMEAKANAERERIQAQTNADVAIIAAESDLKVQKINADAAEYTGVKEAAKNKAIAESLTKELVEYYEIMNWNGVMPTTVVNGDSTPILNIGEE